MTAWSRRWRVVTVAAIALPVVLAGCSSSPEDGFVESLESMAAEYESTSAEEQASTAQQRDVELDGCAKSGDCSQVTAAVKVSVFDDLDPAAPRPLTPEEASGRDWQGVRVAAIRGDFSGMDLSGIDLAGGQVASPSDLTGVDFAGADLTGADLGRQPVVGADFTGAKTSGMRVDLVDLTGAVGLDVPSTVGVPRRCPSGQEPVGSNDFFPGGRYEAAELPIGLLQQIGPAMHDRFGVCAVPSLKDVRDLISAESP